MIFMSAHVTITRPKVGRCRASYPSSVGFHRQSSESTGRIQAEVVNLTLPQTVGESAAFPRECVSSGWRERGARRTWHRRRDDAVGGARFEAGGTVPTLPGLERIARALDIDLTVRVEPRPHVA